MKNELICNHEFEWEDGSISVCHLEKGHEGNCEGYVHGSKCYFSKRYSSAEEIYYADYMETMRCEANR